MERFFQFLAVALVGAAAFFWMRESYEWAFVTGVLGACSFFLAVRFQIRSRMKERDLNIERQDETREDA
jgi:hypothetical protein